MDLQLAVIMSLKQQILETEATLDVLTKQLSKAQKDLQGVCGRETGHQFKTEFVDDYHCYRSYQVCEKCHLTL
jgi:hypothetical protein